MLKGPLKLWLARAIFFFLGTLLVLWLSPVMAVAKIDKNGLLLRWQKEFATATAQRFDVELAKIHGEVRAGLRPAAADVLTNENLLAETYSQLEVLRSWQNLKSSLSQADLALARQRARSKRDFQNALVEHAAALRKTWRTETQSSVVSPNLRSSPEHRYQILPSLSAKGNLTGGQYPDGEWSVTYDDGPHPSRTTEMIRVWQGEADPSFFWLGQNIERQKNLVRSIMAAGYLINSHSFNHPDLTRVGAAERTRQVEGAVQTIDQLLADSGAPFSRSFFYRLPYGAGMNDPDLRQRLLKLKLIHVKWNVDTLDWQDRDPQVIFRRTVQQIEVARKGIILFHDIHLQSIEASRLLVEYFRAHRAQFSVRDMKAVVDDVNGKPLEEILEEI